MTEKTIYFKFKSERAFDTVTFRHEFMGLRELKDEIARKRQLSELVCNLELSADREELMIFKYENDLCKRDL